MTWLAALLLATALVGLWRVLRGPTAADRMVAAQLIGTSGAALLLVLAHHSQVPALRDTALVLALLAAVLTAALVQYLRGTHHD